MQQTGMRREAKRVTGRRLRRATGGLAAALVGLCLAAPSATAQLEPVQVADLRPGGANGNPSGLEAAGGNLFFNADADPAIGNELYRSDGTAGGTGLVAEILAGPADASPRELTALGDSVIFNANSSAAQSDQELWRSDGTAAGTTRVLDIYPGEEGSFPNDFEPLGGALFFAANDGTTGNEVWRTDGTPAGTTLVANIHPGAASASNPSGFTAFNGFVYFRASDGTNGFELWRTDGTTTNMVANINAAASSFPGGFTAFNGFLYFQANDGTNGTELWRTDGTTTTMVANISPAGSSNPGDFEAVGDHLYFRASDGSNGDELWRTDGTTTTMVANIATGAESSDPEYLTALAGSLIFAADDNPDQNNDELWRSDGTPEGTVKVKEIAPSLNEGSFPAEFTPLDGSLYFEADDGETGIELWRTDGTSGGTQPVGDINPGGNNASIDDLTPFQGTLFFGAESEAGDELWKLAAPAPPPADTTDPVLTAKAKNKLKKKLVVKASCDEACELAGKGKVTATPAKSNNKRAKKQSFKLKSGSASLAAGSQGKLTLAFKGKDFKKAKAAKKDDAKLAAKITVTATDAAGNATTQKLKLKLR